MIFRLAIFAAAGYLLYKLFMGSKKKKMEQSKQEKEQKIQAGDMVQDPVCGTYVSAESHIRVREGGKVHRFCSFECRDAYLKEKEQS